MICIIGNHKALNSNISVQRKNGSILYFNFVIRAFKIQKKLVTLQQNNKKERRFQDMARPIKETPILFGKDARIFEQRMKLRRQETPKQKAERLADYHAALSMMEM